MTARARRRTGIVVIGSPRWGGGEDVVAGEGDRWYGGVDVDVDVVGGGGGGYGCIRGSTIF